MPDAITTEPLLQTLAPALRALETNLRGWLQTKHQFPQTTLARATLEGLADEFSPSSSKPARTSLKDSRLRNPDR